MPRLSLCNPKPGESEIADQIRERRHPRELLTLDSVLLHDPLIASGWNSLFGAIRSHSSLPADFRELLILRVAALNLAPYEWIQHEKVGREAGLTTPQLMRIRDTIKPLTTDPQDHSYTKLSDLHLAGLSFTDSLTKEIQVRDANFERLKAEFRRLSNQQDQVEKMILDATATVAGYNMVSRILVGLEVGDDRDQSVELPGLETRCEKLTMSDGTRLHVRYQLMGSRPTLMFCNSLLSNMGMWNWILPSLATKYNLVCFDQRGHGQSDVPKAYCTLRVSQGGATTLELSTRHPHLFQRHVVCGTQPSSPAEAQAAWASRIQRAQGSEDGMKTLSEATIARWFPIESHLNQPNNQIATCVKRMIEETTIEGFEKSAAALYNYQVDEDQIPRGQHKVLFVAGERDGVLPTILQGLSERLSQGGNSVPYVGVPGAGHLPMVDQPLRFLNIIEPFLNS
ncbi:hypothetical protein PCANC_18314 [Puccinia coronata f. sp. avenae]|uniref:Carboxymuconolactone decarboxylase-like domain-containing protein n=1 Tax=Puccinia coronata f. sp. avenae TaxID=200324 RepID=A0A2N5SGG1_9BASI|nr:hypothetical protein PCANC_18314 [Puccinia coronata f. sp. avenae]